MCGIAGIFNYRSFAPVEEHVVRSMTTVLSHRGPDADGVYVDGPLGLGHRRLAIIDLNERSRQPMLSSDGRYVIAFNGEIYNYLEIKDRLKSLGVRFRTDSDTEVLLSLFATERAGCLQHLNGMFAFAAWDKVRQELFIARDRVGIKPLYYVLTDDGLLFASEAKALFQNPAVRPEVDTSEVETFLTFGYVPGEATMFRGIRKLLPGHCLTINARGVTVRKYWDVDYAPNLDRGERDTAEELHALLFDAVRLHLRSDVPLGVFLSGGLDSSAVVSLLSKAGVDGIKTFAVAYRQGHGFDESPHAQRVSDKFGTEHHVLYVEPGKFQEFIPDYVWYMDEPVTEAAALSLYFVARELKQYVTVALSGEGADELFGGYRIYQYMRWLEAYRRIPSAIRKGLLDPALSRLPHVKLRKYGALARLPLERRYLGVSLHDAMARQGLYSREFSRSLTRTGEDALRPYYARTVGLDTLTRMLYTDLKTWLVDDLLIKADKMTMASSVELRVPFLDHRVVEFAATIPSHLKLRGNEVKWILKRSMASHLPTQTLARPKVGFPTPLALMFRENLSDYLHDVLLSRQARDRGYFDYGAVSRLIREHVSGGHDHHKTLWQLTVLEEWHQRFVDSRPVTELPREHVSAWSGGWQQSRSAHTSASIQIASP